MLKLNSNAKLFINLAKLSAVMNRRFDCGLGGLGFNEFIILYHLSQAENEQLRRIDLAEKIGLTASGVTRILLPMEKVHLIKSGAQENDARVRYVVLAAGGKEKLTDALERIEFLSEEILEGAKIKNVEKLTENILALSKNI